jgi:hypothetical protein
MKWNEELLQAIVLKQCSELDITGLTCKIYKPCQDVLLAPKKKELIMAVLLSQYMFLRVMHRELLNI